MSSFTSLRRRAERTGLLTLGSLPAVMSTWVRARRPTGLRWSNRSSTAERIRARSMSVPMVAAARLVCC